MILFLHKTFILFFVLRGDLSEDDSEEEEEEAEEESRQKMGQKEEEGPDLQINLDIDEQFKLPTSEQIEKEDILFICNIHKSCVHKHETWIQPKNFIWTLSRVLLSRSVLCMTKH